MQIFILTYVLMIESFFSYQINKTKLEKGIK